MYHQKKKMIMKPIVLIVLLFATIEASAQTPWIAPEESKKIVNPLEGNQSAVLKGKELFELLCTVCHGETGKGDGVTLEHLIPKPANLTAKKVQAQTPGEFYWKITTGRPPMQSYVNVLSPDEMWMVISYIKTLGAEDGD